MPFVVILIQALNMHGNSEGFSELYPVVLLMHWYHGGKGETKAPRHLGSRIMWRCVHFQENVCVRVCLTLRRLAPLLMSLLRIRMTPAALCVLDTKNNHSALNSSKLPVCTHKGA